jgi:filamentous hemagglutinin family protein
MKPPIRSRLLAGAAALGVLISPRAAFAQAFDGTPVVVHGSVTRSTGPGTETIFVETPSAVVNWIPNSNADPTPFDFLPSGNVATFRNGGQTENFMILNRILPDSGRPIAFNGTVISQLVGNSGATPGGTVVFYTPGGIVIGGTAVFDVGNLLLTTIDPVLDESGSFFVGNSYQLGGAKTDAASFVRIEPGARINAPGPGSYVAAAAPIIRQDGAVRVNGSVAYVAAEAVDLTIDGGLFDIRVKVGSSSAAATLDHRGSTGGPAGEDRAIYMVAVPKNDAVSLLLRGNAGYDVAANAAEENGAIILSAGYDVDRTATKAAPASEAPANIDIRQASITSDLTGLATARAAATAFAGEALTFAGDVTLVAPDAALGSEGGMLSVGGDAVVTTGRGGDFNFTAATGGTASLFARGGGAVQIAGSARTSASTLSPPGQAASGGDATVTADSGRIAIGGGLLVEADSEAGSGNFDPGVALGGNARLAALNGGKVQVLGATQVTASALGATGFGLGDGAPGAAQGGVASVAALGGEIELGALAVRASGTGGPAFAGTPGAGLGGDARVQASAGGRITVGGPARVEADGVGGTGIGESPESLDVSGAAGAGGSARVRVDGGNVRFDSLEVRAVGAGGAATGSGTSGGSGAGGLAQLDVASGSLAARDSVLRAFGAAGPNGSGTGGNVVVAGPAGSITGDRLFAEAGVDGTLGGIRMTQQVDLAAQRRITIAGRVEAPAVSLASRDIDVPAAGEIAAAGVAAFRVLPTGTRTQIGGAAAGPGYTLDRNELGRVTAGRISVNVPEPDAGLGPPPEVIVDALTLAADLQPDPFAFEIATPGTIRVVGDVLMNGAGAGDTLAFTADRRFEVVTPGGSLRMLDSAGNPAGSLTIASSNIVVADSALAAQLAADPDFAGRNLALLVNPAPAVPRGHVEAGGVHFIVKQPQGVGPPGTLFVQNTGAHFADLAGVTVGAGGLRISPVGLATVQGFGRRRNPDGSFTTGDAFFRIAAYDRSGGAFTDESEFNLCKINGGLCPPRLPAGARPALARTVLGPPLPPEAEPRDGVIDASGLAGIPLIDEPVISGGDSSLWDEDEEDEE